MQTGWRPGKWSNGLGQFSYCPLLEFKPIRIKAALVGAFAKEKGVYLFSEGRYLNLAWLVSHDSLYPGGKILEGREPEKEAK